MSMSRHNLNPYWCFTTQAFGEVDQNLNELFHELQKHITDERNQEITFFLYIITYAVKSKRQPPFNPTIPGLTEFVQSTIEYLKSSREQHPEEFELQSDCDWCGRCETCLLIKQRETEHQKRLDSWLQLSKKVHHFS